MLEPCDVIKALRIRVWVTRLGGMSEEQFALYSAVLRNFDRINLAELTPLLTATSSSSAPFAKCTRAQGS